MIHEIHAEVGDNNLRVDKFLSNKITDLSRSQIKHLIEAGFLQVNGSVLTDASYKIKATDTFTLDIKQNTHSSIVPQKIDFEILYEDEDLMVINKPAGLTVHPGAGQKDNTLVNALAYHLDGKLSSIGLKDARPGIVHRLDKETSGVMLVAKTDFAHVKLAKYIKDREVERTYLALVYGHMTPIHGTISTYFGRSKKERTKMTVLRSGTRMAITHFKVLKTFAEGTLSLVELKLETGRTHQIRVHMEFKKHPIVGDRVYGKALNHNLNTLPSDLISEVRNFPRQALHAHKIAFPHPRTEEIMEFEAAPPKDFSHLLEELDQ
jgi:23S rRNA pseudouridine1911/1915/1917 synthase